MSPDRYLKVVLTVIAVALSVIAMVLVELPPTASATVSQENVELAERDPELVAGEIEGGRQEQQLREEPSGVAPSAPTSTLPLRWRIPFATHTDSSVSGNMDCATHVSVVGFAPDHIEVHVEFFDAAGGSAGLSNWPLDTPGEQEGYMTSGDVETWPLSGITANTGNFTGYALVFADDPRIFVGAHLICHEEGAGHFPAVLTNLSAYPVGQTASFFRAGIPGAAPMPPTAAVTEPGS